MLERHRAYGVKVSRWQAAGDGQQQQISDEGHPTTAVPALGSCGRGRWLKQQNPLARAWSSGQLCLL